MYVVIQISRAHSSGYENMGTMVFTTLEEVANYLQNDWYESFCEAYNYPSDWDEEDMGGPFPSKESFSADAIQKAFGKYNEARMFDYYSEYCGLKPDEIIVQRKM